MGTNLESYRSEEINETPEVEDDSEQLSETEETSENFDDCFLNEVQDSNGNEVNAESLEDAEEDYDDCEAKIEETRENNPELTEEDEDFSDCGKETEDQYVVEVTYFTDGEISQEKASTELQEVYNECDDPEDMQQLKENANENERIEVCSAEVVERPENSELDEEVTEEEYKETQEGLEEAQENPEVRQEAVQKYQESLESQNKREYHAFEKNKNINNESSEGIDTETDDEVSERTEENDEAEDVEDTSDDPPKVLKRDENDLRQSGDKAIEKRLEAKEDDYRDKGLSEEEIATRLEADREEYEKELADDSPYGDSSSEETSEVESYTAETNENYSDNADDELSGDENKLEHGDYPPEAEEVPEVEEPYHARRIESTEQSEEVPEVEDPYRARRTESTEQSEEVPEVEEPYHARRTESTEQSEEVPEVEDPYRARRTESTEQSEEVPEVEEPYRARRTESTEQSEEVPEAEEPYRARRTESTEQPEEETDWERTSLNPENEAIIRDMDDNDEIDIPEVNPDWKEPKETEPHRPTFKSGEFEGERGNSAFYPKDHEVLDDMARFGQDHVDYVDNNPDFSPFAVHDTPWGEADSTVEIGHMTDQRKNPGIEGFRRPHGSSHDTRYDLGNFSQADNALTERIKARYPDSNVTPELIEKYRTDQKLVWHECADGKTMQLVPEKIHNACRHSGGVSVEKRNMAYGDITAPIDD